MMSSICAAPESPEFFSLRKNFIQQMEILFLLRGGVDCGLGFAVASRGWNSLMLWKSPVSATTIVNFFSCSSSLSWVPVF